MVPLSIGCWFPYVGISNTRKNGVAVVDFGKDAVIITSGLRMPKLWHIGETRKSLQHAMSVDLTHYLFQMGVQSIWHR